MRKVFHVELLFSVLFIFSLFLFGCGSEKSEELAKEQAKVAYDYFEHNPGYDNFTVWESAFGLVYGEDTYGNAIPVIVLDEEKTVLLERTVQAFNCSFEGKEKLTIEEAKAALTDNLVQVLYQGKNGDASLPFRFIEWLSGPSTLIVLKTGEIEQSSITVNLKYIRFSDDKEGWWAEHAYPWETEKIAAYKATHDVGW